MSPPLPDLHLSGLVVPASLLSLLVAGWAGVWTYLTKQRMALLESQFRQQDEVLRSSLRRQEEAFRLVHSPQRLRALCGMGRWALLVSAAVLALTPTTAAADGGGPIFIIAGPIAFLVAQVWIIGVELLLLRRIIPAMRWGDAWGDVTSANLRSYVLVGILVPAAASIASLGVGAAAGYLLTVAGFTELAARVSGALMGFGGWVVDSEDVVRGLPYGLAGWFVVTFFLSVFVEGRTLDRRWAARGFTSPVTPTRASWLLNLGSYAGLTAGVVWIVVEIVRSRGAS